MDSPGGLRHPWPTARSSRSLLSPSTTTLAPMQNTTYLSHQPILSALLLLASNGGKLCHQRLSTLDHAFGSVARDCKTRDCESVSGRPCYASRAHVHTARCADLPPRAVQLQSAKTPGVIQALGPDSRPRPVQGACAFVPSLAMSSPELIRHLESHQSAETFDRQGG